MTAIKAQLKKLFHDLNIRIEEINRERSGEGLIPFKKANIRLLGQVSLLANEKVSLILTLAQTGDLDAALKMDHVVKEELKKLLLPLGFIYDEDSFQIWIPPGSVFEKMFDLPNLSVESIDPESALVSKAVKAPLKNKVLIREAIASNAFPKLAARIVKNGGRLEDFL